MVPDHGGQRGLLRARAVDGRSARASAQPPSQDLRRTRRGDAAGARAALLAHPGRDQAAALRARSGYGCGAAGLGFLRRRSAESDRLRRSATRFQTMIPNSILVANRGEIAIRIIRAAAELGIRTVAIFSEDDRGSLHTVKADRSMALRGTGPAAYLDVDQIIDAARQTGCDAIHPGYGFLSENAGFARRCAGQGITFIGPRPEMLELFGAKIAARNAAQQCGVPVLDATAGATSLEQAREFFAAHSAGIMIKAVAGGGGRGMRAVHRIEELEPAFERCQSEARAAFGIGDVYVERLMPSARHIEVQVLGDRNGDVAHLWERECTIQRRHQKLVEVAPSPAIGVRMRQLVTGAAIRIAASLRYDNLGTFEFLVSSEDSEDGRFVFIEANPRLQVEHTVTEEVTGVDLVKAQILLAAGKRLEEAGLRLSDPAPRGFAIQLRINAESIGAGGAARPSSGKIAVFEPPLGPGLRVDTCAYAGYATNSRFDSLLAKLIVRCASPEFRSEEHTSELQS